MRISDWSSDVCSSDLLWAGPAGRALAEWFAELEARAALGPREIAPESLAPLVRTLLDETAVRPPQGGHPRRSEEHTSELQSLMRISYAVFCLKKNNERRQPPCAPPTPQPSSRHISTLLQNDTT